MKIPKSELKDFYRRYPWTVRPAAFLALLFSWVILPVGFFIEYKAEFIWGVREYFNECLRGLQGVEDDEEPIE